MIHAAASLTNRIFLACTLLATLSLGFAFYFVNARAASEAEAELRRGLTDAAALVDQHRATQTDTFTRFARLVADLPKLKAGVYTSDLPTVQPLATEYREEMKADLLVVSNRNQVLARAGTDSTSLPPGVVQRRSSEEIALFLPHPRGILQIVSVPILGVPGEILGRLTVGFFLDDPLASQFKGLTASDIAFGADGRILAATFPANVRQQLIPVMHAQNIVQTKIGDEEYLALTRPLHSGPGLSAGPAAASPVVVILRSRTERLRFLNTLRAGLAGALILTVLLATILSYAVARTMTRPLSAITSAMREVAATGDLTRKVVLRSRAWDDEDARLLAAAFNTLTESIAKFQAEAAQKERLSSLGRLSTVVAHEVRNPLMIIRAALRTLQRDDLTPSETRDAISDIDEEITRLNRIVTEVLDFAKPIRFELAAADVNDICRASAAAAWIGDSDPPVAFDLDPTVPAIATDAERLRTALVNILTNARHAVQATTAATHDDHETGTVIVAGPGVIVKTRGAGDRVSVTIQDQGIGIAPEDMAHIFDPYFTTRRAGTGLGLPISKNIIEGLGGTLVVRSRVGHGTEIHIELPVRAPEAAA